MAAIRTAVVGDLPRMKEMVHSMFDETTAEFAHTGGPEAVDDLLEFALATDQSLFLAEMDGDLVGLCAWVVAPSCTNSEVLGLGTYIEPSYRGNGISSALRDQATKHWIDEGATVIQGSVDLGNTVGLASAERNGFEIVGYLVEKTLVNPRRCFDEDEFDA